MLGCSREETNEYFLTQPCLIIEILSKSTATIDRREKLIAYQSIPSVREYCLIAQNTYRVERYHRLNETELWHTPCMKKAIVCSFPVLIIHLAWLIFMRVF